MKKTDMGSILGGENPLQQGTTNPLQYSCLENLMNRGTWWATVHGVVESWNATEATWQASTQRKNSELEFQVTFYDHSALFLPISVPFAHILWNYFGFERLTLGVILLAKLGLVLLSSRMVIIRAITRLLPCASAVKNPPAMQETQEMRVWFLDWEDLLEKEMATHSSILAS